MPKDNKMMLRVALDKETHKVLKMKSVELETTMQDIIEKLIRDWLEKQNTASQESI